MSGDLSQSEGSLPVIRENGSSTLSTRRIGLLYKTLSLALSQSEPLNQPMSRATSVVLFVSYIYLQKGSMVCVKLSKKRYALLVPPRVLLLDCGGLDVCYDPAYQTPGMCIVRTLRTLCGGCRSSAVACLTSRQSVRRSVRSSVRWFGCLSVCLVSPPALSSYFCLSLPLPLPLSSCPPMMCGLSVRWFGCPSVCLSVGPFHVFFAHFLFSASVKLPPHHARGREGAREERRGREGRRDCCASCSPRLLSLGHLSCLLVDDPGICTAVQSLLRGMKNRLNVTGGAPVPCGCFNPLPC